MLKGWINAVKFDGVDFSHLICTGDDASGRVR
jgi:hypothetical protein